MTPESVADMIERHGETVTLRRPGTPDVDATPKAKVRGYQPHELVNGIVQGDRQVIIGATTLAAFGWPAPPSKAAGDRVLIDGKPTAVQGVETRKIGEDAAMYVIQVRG
jgi:hypothetical protein